MEVFMHNLPDTGLTAETLHGLLEPSMTQLGISRDHYHCDKNRSRRFAFVTFLHSSEGERFLHSYGQREVSPNAAGEGRRVGISSRFNNPGSTRRPQLMSDLKLLGSMVFCKKGDREPKSITLRGMEHSARTAAENSDKLALAHGKAKKRDHGGELEREPKSEDVVMLSVHSFYCGHYAFIDEKLAFFPERGWNHAGNAKFTKLNLVVTVDDGQAQMRIPLNTIVEIVWSYSGYFTLTLSTVPWFLEERASLEDMILQFTMYTKPRQDQRYRMIALDRPHEEITGTCLIYQFHTRDPDLGQMMSSLRKRNVAVITQYELTTVSSCIHPSLGDFKQQLQKLKDELSGATKENSLPFDTLFVLQALLYGGYLHPRVIRGMLRRLCHRYNSSEMKGRRTISVEAVKSLMDSLDWPSPHEDPKMFELDSIMEWIEEKDKEIRDGYDIRKSQYLQSPNLTRIYRATVTPTRITLHGPEVENMNRVLRKYRDKHDFFLRVQFCDENGQDLRFSASISYERVYDRFRDVLKRGIMVAGRTYSFLGFSHSSLRSHSVWFSAPFFHQGTLMTHHNIVKGLGDFDHIQCPAKCAARIGQAFSETPSVVDLKDCAIDVKMIPDVKSSDGSRVFSDGVGGLSEEAMQDIWDHIPPKKNAPTCFQIRFGGCKGMLALNMTLPGKQICIRPSMLKFESMDRRNLEICDMGSKPIPLVLNRQMIKILEDMGVDKNWFLTLQGHRLNELRLITASAYNTANFLNSQDVGLRIKFGKFIQLADKQGMDYRRDPFLRGIVEAVVLRELRLLKHKARIPVAQGKTLFGIMDETGLLEEGEVYVTFGFTKSGTWQQPPGHWDEVIITRSPALHPGDIQLVRNIVPPKGHPLEAHTNCVVFSRRGSRDLPSQLSGGDLDGDIYNVIWDKTAMPRRTFEPASYPRVEAMDIGRPVNRDDMADFFVDFMKTDHLGVIAHRHVILADQQDEGTNSADCRKLAELHSTAVDFSKSGKPVELKELPRASQFRPDFLAPGPVALVDKGAIELEDDHTPPDEKPDADDGEMPRYKYYRSTKILGELYREVDEKKIWYDDVRSKIDMRGPSFWDRFLEWAFGQVAKLGHDSGQWVARAEDARLLKEAYDDAIFGHMCKHSEHPVNPISENEVFIGAIFNKTGVQTHRQRDSSQRLRDEFDRTAAWIMREMRGGAAGSAPAADAPLTGYLAELGRFASLDLCLACVCIASLRDCEWVKLRLGGNNKDWGWHQAHRGAGRRGAHGEGLQSFRVVAASAFLRELKAKQVELGVGLD